MKKIIKLTETDLIRIIKKTLKEQSDVWDVVAPDIKTTPPAKKPGTTPPQKPKPNPNQPPPLVTTPPNPNQPPIDKPKKNKINITSNNLKLGNVPEELKNKFLPKVNIVLGKTTISPENDVPLARPSIEYHLDFFDVYPVTVEKRHVSFFPAELIQKDLPSLQIKSGTDCFRIYDRYYSKSTLIYVNKKNEVKIYDNR